MMTDATFSRIYALAIMVYVWTFQSCRTPSLFSPFRLLTFMDGCPQSRVSVVIGQKTVTEFWWMIWLHIAWQFHLALCRVDDNEKDINQMS